MLFNFLKNESLAHSRITTGDRADPDLAEAVKSRVD